MKSNIEEKNRRLIMAEKLYVRERLEYLANVLAEHCHRDEPCIYNENRFDSYCPFEDSTIGCGEITPADWLKYMQGLEVSEL